MSCLQSLAQWLGFAATPLARIRLRPTAVTASAARNFFSVIRDSPTSAHANFALLDLLQFFAVRTYSGSSVFEAGPHDRSSRPGPPEGAASAFYAFAHGYRQ